MPRVTRRPNTALLIIDVQVGVLDGAHARAAVIANIARLVDKARQERVPVIWVQHCAPHLSPGSDPWGLVAELSPDATEPRISKAYTDAFDHTHLDATLSQLSVGHVVVAGAQTDACIRATLHGALVRGYSATLVSDAHTTKDQTAWGAPPPDEVIAHMNLGWARQTAHGRRADTAATAHINFTRGCVACSASGAHSCRSGSVPEAD